MATTLGKLNPFRYRGYVYDEETGLYYLQSRYYNPEWGRFLNADSVFGSKGKLLSHILSCYCENNRTVDTDANGMASEYFHDKVMINTAASLYLGYMGYDISSEMFSLFLSGGGAHISENLNEKIGKAVNQSIEFNAGLTASIKNHSGLPSWSDTFSPVFPNGDLFYALHNVKINIQVTVKGSIAFGTTSMDDDYDFDFWDDTIPDSFGKTVNNFGYWLQQTGLATPYPVYVEFNFQRNLKFPTSSGSGGSKSYKRIQQTK